MVLRPSTPHSNLDCWKAPEPNPNVTEESELVHPSPGHSPCISPLLGSFPAKGWKCIDPKHRTSAFAGRIGPLIAPTIASAPQRQGIASGTALPTALWPVISAEGVHQSVGGGRSCRLCLIACNSRQFDETDARA